MAPALTLTTEVEHTYDPVTPRSPASHYLRIPLSPSLKSPTIKYKPRVSHKILPREFYASFISTLSKSRKPSPIRHLFPYELEPNMLSMLAGKPNPMTFPFTSISLTVRAPTPSADAQESVIDIRGKDLASALQYGPTRGDPELLQWMTQFMSQVHGRADGEGWKVFLGSGSQDLLYKAFLALVDPGDAVLVEAPTYAGILPIIDTLKCETIEVSSDSEGLVPSSLTSILSSWPKNKPYPKLLYTVPYGSNPTGTTIPLAQRLEVLALARKYNFLILEDDPYFHVYFGSAPRPPSYFELEKTIGGEMGRVLRFDSFSKVLAAGFRLGWTTGPDVLIEAMELHGACSNMQPASTSQVMVHSLLKLWGVSGFLAHTDHVATFYKHKRDMFEQALERHLAGLAEWTSPNSGMFFWIKLLLPPSVDCQSVKSDEGDSSVFIRTKAIRRGVLVLPGESSFFHERKTAHVRVSFSLLSDDETDEALRRLASLLREEWGHMGRED